MATPHDYGFTEPSGIALSNSDRADSVFSDISVISRGEYFFIAKAMRYGKWFAVKGLNPEFQNQESLVTLLHKEFELMLGLTHPNIRHVLSLESVPGYGTCIIMEYIEGESLAKWLEKSHPEASRIRIAAEIADAIEYMHRKGTVHRDIKPENILITHIGETVKVIDLGLSDSDEFAVLKEPGGTIPYISPEQAAGGAPDTANDIYSLGMLLKRLLPEQRFSKIIKDCTGDASRRPQTAAAVKERILRKPRRNLAGIVIAAAALAAVATGVILYLIPGRQEAPADAPSPLAIASDTAVGNRLQTEEDVVTAPVARTENAVGSAPPTLPETKGSDNTNEEISGRMSRSESMETFYNEGVKTLQMSWEGICQLYKRPTDYPPTPEELDLLRKVKENYISNLRYMVNNTTSFSQKYDFSNDDLDLLSGRLDSFLSQYLPHQ